MVLAPESICILMLRLFTVRHWGLILIWVLRESMHFSPRYNPSDVGQPASMAQLIASRYALPGYGDRGVWVRGPGWLNHCVRL